MNINPLWVTRRGLYIFPACLEKLGQPIRHKAGKPYLSTFYSVAGEVGTKMKLASF